MPLTSGVGDPERWHRSLIPGVGTPEIWVTFDIWLRESTLNNEEWLNGILNTIEADIVRVLGYFRCFLCCINLKNVQKIKELYIEKDCTGILL